MLFTTCAHTIRANIANRCRAAPAPAAAVLLSRTAAEAAAGAAAATAREISFPVSECDASTLL